ncbi:MAG: hypothetical protein GC159_18820 [Phycisphaera sp.]|nr:hypothetical protein [Phycisphaera sp.]
MPFPFLSDYDARARPKPNTFYPPKTSPTLIRLLRLGIRRSIRRKLDVTEIEISDADLDTLRRLKGQRVMLTPSHSGGFEPHIVMYLSKLLDDIYNFIAAIELFEQAPINSWLMPRLGVYSVIRGAIDRPSLSMTRKLLTDAERWLVVFPEGQTIWQNSTLVPFQQGVFQLAFKAYEDARKADNAAHLYCVPMAIKYVYLRDMHDDIDASLATLEHALAIDARAADDDHATPLSRYARLRRIAEAVVIANEKSHGVTPAEGASMNDRIQGLKEFAIARLEQQLDITPPARATLLDRIRTLFNAVDRVVADDPAQSPYEHALAEERQQVARTFYDDLWRVLQFVAIYDGYVGESMTVERFMDVLCLLEKEVLKRRHVWGPRKALVRVGEPVDLRDRFDAYTNDKRATASDVTMQIETAVRTMLDDLSQGAAMVRDA